MRQRSSYDCATGVRTIQALSPEEETRFDEAAAIFNAEIAAELARGETIKAARPALAILAKLRDGTALTATELQAVTRWLALREVREILG